MRLQILLRPCNKTGAFLPAVLLLTAAIFKLFGLNLDLCFNSCKTANGCDVRGQAILAEVACHSIGNKQ